MSRSIVLRFISWYQNCLIIPLVLTAIIFGAFLHQWLEEDIDSPLELTDDIHWNYSDNLFVVKNEIKLEPMSAHVLKIYEHLSNLQKSSECLACQPAGDRRTLCDKYPGRYGCPSYVMIWIIISNRQGYTTFTSSVLRKYNNIAESDIHLLTDRSDEIDFKTLQGLYGSGAKYFNPIGVKPGGTMIQYLLNKFLMSEYKLLLLLEDDMILLKDWLSFIEEHITHTDGILSLYHPSVNHSFAYDCENQKGELCVGESTQNSGFVLTKSIAESWLSKINDSKSHYGWNELLEQDSIELFYPVKSLTMHIGQQHQDKENCGTNEVAHRFNRCEYPSWIKEQIEFYFDRCTSPDEIYPDDPDSIEFKTRMKKRFWVRPAISYSFYGYKTRYIAIALGNAARVSRIYPGWKIWLYHDDSVPDPYLQTFCEYDARFIDMTGTKLINQMSWRFLVASEPVKRWAIRDIDSHLLRRGKAAVDEWIVSGKKFHIIKDHPNHSKHAINGGSWGGNSEAMPNMREELEKYVITNAYMEDMNFLKDIVWPVAEKSAWINDAYSIHMFGEDHPFPTKLEVDWSFVCNVILYP